MLSQGKIKPVVIALLHERAMEETEAAAVTEMDADDDDDH